MPLMGVNPPASSYHVRARRCACRQSAACWVLQYDIHPQSSVFRADAFLVCVLGGLGNMIGGFLAAFIFAQFTRWAGTSSTSNGACAAFLFFIAFMFWRPQGLLEASQEAGLALDRCCTVGGRPACGDGQLPAPPDAHGLMWAFVYTTWHLWATRKPASATALSRIGAYGVVIA